MFFPDTFLRFFFFNNRYPGELNEKEGSTLSFFYFFSSFFFNGNLGLIQRFFVAFLFQALVLSCPQTITAMTPPPLPPKNEP